MSECIAATTSSSERVCGIDTNTCSSSGQRCERDSAASSVESSVPNVIEMATTATEAAFARQFSAHDVAGRQSARPGCSNAMAVSDLVPSPLATPPVSCLLRLLVPGKCDQGTQIRKFKPLHYG